MNRIDTCFQALQKIGKKALIPYLTGGDPHPDLTVDFMHKLVESGADIIEVGVPFSDPMADGPVIQLACERALLHNTSLTDVLSMVKTFRETDTTTPVVLMGYLNPVEVMGVEKFVKLAADSGLDGVLIVDMPPEESKVIAQLASESGLKLIFLIAPTTPEKRIKMICEHASGYLYYVSVKGVTGSAALDVEDVEQHLQAIRRATSLPLAVGFGIKDGETAAKVARIADGVIVGSALVRCIERNPENVERIQQELTEIMLDMRSSMDEI